MRLTSAVSLTRLLQIRNSVKLSKILLTWMVVQSNFTVLKRQISEFRDSQREEALENFPGSLVLFWDTTHADVGLDQNSRGASDPPSLCLDYQFHSCPICLPENKIQPFLKDMIKCLTFYQKLPYRTRIQTKRQCHWQMSPITGLISHRYEALAINTLKEDMTRGRISPENWILYLIKKSKEKSTTEKYN